jgi:GAF domain-containing protein
MTELEALHASVLAALSGDAPAGKIDLFGRVCRTFVRLVPVDGAAVTVVAKTGQRELLHATDAVSTALAELQYSLGEGPGFEAHAGGEPVLVPDLDAGLPPAWPIFAVEAAAQPVKALFSFPVKAGAVCVATLDAHRATPGPLGNGDLGTALQVAGITALALSGLSADVGRWLDGDGREMSGAGMRYQQVSQATGMVMVELTLPPGAALARIRAYAFERGRSLLDVAADIVTRRVDLGEIAGEEPR